jgi:glutathione peroxidase
MTSVYDFAARSITGEEITLSRWRGQALLIVNVASQCGFTSQYEGLELLQKTYGPRGFAVLGFPCNQFGAQEPGDESQIAQFCEARFGVSFPMFAKVEVNGEGAHPLFKHLKAAKTGVFGTEGIKWNFTKFLVDRAGEVAGRYASTTTPAALAPEIERLLAAPAP